MLANLLGNAIKFTATGHIQVQANEIAQDGQTALLEFSVTDTGMGIAPEKLNLLFKPFSQTDSTTTRQFGGSGLGLSIVRSLAHLLGGDVGVQSEPGQGSRFWFRVIVEVLPPTEQRIPPVSDAHPQDQRLLGPETRSRAVPTLSARVLVVEDNAVNCLVIEGLLAQMALTVDVVHDGQQALARVQAGEVFDVILMDLQMPVMDGYASTTAIRDWELRLNRARTPVIALTADAFEEDRQHCLAVGMDGFLTKPIAQRDLVSALQAYLPVKT
jgi:CheY-like chemotaxis protein